ncbi:WxL domain-containing protein [Levilactobacillus yonginensis]|uniref:WxL domain-containing protein n=1 Tax=Levilactobacillus yonginensis TaxID=1054041 RepID=UPI000F78403C|nr:WxL domain-containing protein [Levilactobacillus yonginensis]
MRFKKIMLQLGLLLTIVVGVGLVSEQTAKAATVPAGASLISGNSVTFKGYGNSPLRIAGTSSTGWSSLSSMKPSLVSVAANNVKDGRLTDKTTKIYVAFSGTVSVPGNGSMNITNVRADITRSQKLDSIAMKSLFSGATKSFTMSSGYYEIDVNLSDLRDYWPISISIDVKTSDQADYAYMKYAEINPNQSVTTGWDNSGHGLKVNSTYGSSGGGNVARLKSSDTLISGTGMPGMTVMMILTSASGVDSTMTKTVSADGTYSFDLGGPLGKVSPKGTSLYQYNDMGDISMAGDYVVPVLDIHVANPNLTMYPDSVSDNISAKTDAQVLNWLVGEAGITVTHDGDPVVNSDVTFSSATTDLATKIASLTDKQSMIIDVSAALVATPGTKSDGSQPITVTKSDGQLKFGTMSGLNFGSVPVPSKETLIAPADQPNIQIDDSQAANTNWYVTAKASELTSQDGANRTLNGHLVYVDTDGNQEPMSSIVQVASGKRDRSTTYPQNIAAGWATAKSDTSKTPEGIYLDAMPNVYSGSASTAYQGTVTWYLGNVPNMSGTTTDDSSDSSIVNNADASSESGSTRPIVNSGF